eukprot:TRINITY_DN32890_c0_g1_i1.p1 TRINITY_DN32890_c0_g1~~TRINITY_DN32890_c0_g1_i1.p1  ORF type:complete len:614 (+),score=136.39 TRINITY_DN32890_c0_g1_i1:93-1934(+)
MAAGPESPSLRPGGGIRELKIHAISLEKEQWENVSTMIFKSFTMLKQNMDNVKAWSDRTDKILRTTDSTVQRLEERLETLEKTAGELQTGEASLHSHINSLAKMGKLQGLASAGSLQRLDRCMGALFSNFGETFGVELKVEQLEPPAEEETGNSSQEEPTPGSEELRNSDEEENLEETPSRDSGERDAAEGEGEVEQLFSKPPAGIELMQKVGCSLEAKLEGLHDAFAIWTQQQRHADQRTETMQSGIEELRLAADRTRERILTWREMLKESSHAIDSLGQSLATTQASVQDLYATRVQQHEVDTTVNKKAQELIELHGVTEKNVEQLGVRVEEHMTEVQRLVAECRHQTDDRIEEHSSKVSDMVERHMNPLNAYLNTLHVKTDVMRVEIDQLKDQMPKHSARIEDVSSRLTAAQEANAKKSRDIEEQLDATSQSYNARFEKDEGQHAALAGALDELGKALGERIEGVDKSLHGVAADLEFVKREDLSGLARELMSLDQKVAKWVHAHPLPAKISEARLYSLEAKLADEVDARMFFESKVKSRINITPRASRASTGEYLAVDLPQLSQESLGDKSFLTGTGSGFRSARRRPRDTPGTGSSQSSTRDQAVPPIA